MREEVDGDPTWIPYAVEARMLRMTEQERIAICATCRFFETEGDEWGICHRFPPVFTDKYYANEFRMTETPFDNWCGEYEMSQDTRQAIKEGAMEALRSDDG